MRALRLGLLSTCLLLPACKATPPAHATVVADAGRPARQLTVLVTGHESGELPLRAPRLLQAWKDTERWPDVVPLSTGDMFSGNALSSRFDGRPTAEVMKALGYRAAALGNHDLDLGVPVLSAFLDAAGLTLLAGNVRETQTGTAPLPAFTVLEHRGVKLGVVGLTSAKTLYTTGPGRAGGYALTPLAEALPAAVTGARAAGAEALVVVLDDCFGSVRPLVSAHPEWGVDAVVGSRCDGPQELTDGAVAYASVSDDVSAYLSLRVELPADGPHVVTLTRRPVLTEGVEDPDLAALRARWTAQLKVELGQVIGFTKVAYPAEAPALRTLVATALRDGAKADAALINRKGVRAGLPAGPITREAVYSMLPFDNAVLTVTVKGEVLQKLKALPEAVLLLPRPLKPEQDYRLVTTDYVYFDGDGLGFEAAAPNPELTGQVWQTPVVEWLAKQASTPQRPLTLKP
jgi:5'-nucleotidase/UDP-sugar diphosphatase